MQKLQQAPGRGCGRYGLLGFGLLWTGISCCITLPMLVPAVAQLDRPLSALTNPVVLVEVLGSVGFPLVFLGCFGVVGLLAIGLGLKPFIAGARVAAPEIGVSNSNLRSGEEFTLTYRQTFKGPTDVERMTLQLVLRESATYRRGTDTVTVTHDHVVQAFETPARHFEGGETFDERRRLTIPRGAMHSFEANRNRLRWLIKTKVEMKGWPDFDEEYALRVLPELA